MKQFRLVKHLEIHSIAGKWEFFIDYPPGTVFKAERKWKSFGDWALKFVSCPKTLCFPVIGSDSLTSFNLGNKAFQSMFEKF